MIGHMRLCLKTFTNYNEKRERKLSKDLNSLTMKDIKQPVNPPDGTWKALVISGKKKNGGHKNGPDYSYLYTLQMQEPQEDVSEDEIAARGGLDDLSLVFHEIAIWQKADKWKNKKFLLNCGVTEDAMADVSEDKSPELAKGRYILVSGAETIKEGMDTARWQVTATAPLAA